MSYSSSSPPNELPHSPTQPSKSASRPQAWPVQLPVRTGGLKIRIYTKGIHQATLDIIGDLQ